MPKVGIEVMYVLTGRAIRSRTADGGFTLIELLVVMIIIGILAAIAIPVFLNQRAKARDTSTKADISTIGKEISSYFVDGKGRLTVDYTTTPGSVVITDAQTPVYMTTVLLSSGSIPPAPTTAAFQRLDNSGAGWCVALTNSSTGSKIYSVSAASGLQASVCS